MFVVALTVESETDDMEIDIDEACSIINRALAELVQTENVGGGSLGRFGAWGDLQASVRPWSEDWETTEEMIERVEDSAEIMANIRQDTEETA